jgi:hypothetical protein
MPRHASAHVRASATLCTRHKHGCHINVILLSHFWVAAVHRSSATRWVREVSIKHTHWIAQGPINLTVAIRWESLCMKTGRDIPCSGGGLHVGTATDERAQAWRRIRRALEGYATAIVQFIGESYGRDSVQNAWREFTIGSSDQFLGDDPNAELFFSWLFHRWSPEPAGAHKIGDESCYGVPPTRAYLARNASDLDPLQRRYLEACLTACFSFYEILECRPHIGFRARDVLMGSEVEVSEGLASTSLQNGDIVFAQIVSIDGTAMMEAISPFSFPPTLKTGLSALCQHRKWDGRADLALRRLYFRLLESYHTPPLPEVRNTDGEVIEPQVLHFDIGSPQRAFDSLAPLALGTTRQDQLKMAKIGAEGELREATIPWLEPIHSKAYGLETVLMGYIHIRGRKLVVEVSSARRAKTFRQLIANIPAATARYRTTRRRSPDKVPESPSEERGPRVTRH